VPTVLTLTPAFGGARYGPFSSGNVSIGSDPQCQVLVDAQRGVLPLHAWITERPGGWTLHPGVPDAKLCVSRRGARPSPVSAPVDLSEGDGFTLGDRTGVAFLVSSSEGATSSSARTQPASPARAAAGISGPTARPSGPTPRGSGPSAAPRRAPSGPRNRMPTADAFADEAMRMAEVELMRRGPFQQVRQLAYRYRTGALFQPRFILLTLFALVSGSFVTCSGIAASVWAFLH
jgi:hypothetical protein